jgi:hypothetical protein
MGEIRMKRIFALAVAVVLALSCAAFAEAETFSYVITDGAACVTGYTGQEAEFSIPDEIEGCPVTAIASGAFLNLTGISAVTVPGSVTAIGDGAFMGCSALKSVTIASARCELGNMVFLGCDRGLVISAPENSAAQTYAEDGGIGFAALALSEADLYAQAMSALEAGDLEEAQTLFAGLDRYEDSRDYYIYVTARIYEEDGASDKAVALYLIVPDMLDAADRLAALQESAAKSGGVSVGGKLGGMTRATQPPATTEPAESAEPTATPTPAPTTLQSFHEFIGGMPYEFVDNSKEQGMYTIYYYIDDFAQLDAYRALFTDAGWTETDEGLDSDGWDYIYVTSPDGSASFYIAFVETDGLVAFMYDSAADYGFDPINGL